ncbi:YtxH domain-containing protein [Daejeonella sp.]|uniref:YtxH domain-containing protein n=1 Tax=Daejeonella sp. TaxID=2805397 RepID=UPI003982F861
MEDNKNSKIAFAILAGVAAGAATWYFMSTENGKHNWVTLINTVKDITDKLIESGSDGGSFLASAGKEASEYIGNRASGLMEDVKKYS